MKQPVKPSPQVRAAIDVGATELVVAILRDGTPKRPVTLPNTPALAAREPELAAQVERLCSVPGIGQVSALRLLGELLVVPPDLKAKQWVAHAGFDPRPRQSGATDAPRHLSRTAYALRMAAQSLQRSQSALGDSLRRMKARLGAPEAITATAHKLARILHYLVEHRCPYDASVSRCLRGGHCGAQAA